MKYLKRLCFIASAVICMLAADIQTNFAQADDLENLISRQMTSGHSSSRRSGGDADGLIGSAMGLLGVAYRYGGTSAATGFDCSGFMQHVFGRAMQISLPRTAAEQSRMGEAVSRSELQPGDMVFFHTHGRGVSHVGLYIGNGRFIHAPRTGRSIEITNLSNDYWSSRYLSARRVRKNDPSRFLQ